MHIIILSISPAAAGPSSAGSGGTRRPEMVYYVIAVCVTVRFYSARQCLPAHKLRADDDLSVRAANDAANERSHLNKMQIVPKAIDPLPLRRPARLSGQAAGARYQNFVTWKQALLIALG